MAQTYHCICSTLVLATTFPLSHRRKLDQSIILPCPPSSPQVAALASQVQLGEDDGDDDAEQSVSPDMTLFFSTIPATSQAPLLIRSDEGIEKRYPLRCSRCKLMLGYQLDWDQFGAVEAAKEGHTGRREDVAYLLDGAVMTTEDMRKG